MNRDSNRSNSRYDSVNRDYRRGYQQHNGYDRAPVRGGYNDGQYRNRGRSRYPEQIRGNVYRSNGGAPRTPAPVNNSSNYNWGNDWNSGSNNNNNNKKKKWIIAGIAVLLVLIILIGAVVGGISCVLGKIDFMSGDDLAIPDDLDSIVLDDEEITSASDTIDDAQKDALDASIKESAVDEDGLRYEDGVTNILILGLDSRSASTKRSRSDVMIIMSINENSKKIVLSSIMRDTYVAIPGRTGNDKINAASAYGGPALAVETVEGAFGIKIDRFVVVNFYSFMDIVDALGGVTVDINAGERKFLNQYVAEINRVNGLNPNDGKLDRNGENITLTGKQAMGYVRVRYSGNGDYERTERQREVLEQLIQKARQADYATLISILDKVASNVSTDYTMSEITELALNAPEYIDYDISQLRIPADGTYWSGVYKGVWILDIDFEANRDLLYKTVFDNYTN